MFTRVKAAIKAMMTKDATLTTDSYQKNGKIDVYGEFTDSYVYSIPGTLTRRVEARKIREDSYNIVSILDLRHKYSGITGKREREEVPMNVVSGNSLVSVFTKAQAVGMLHDYEKELSQDGIRVSRFAPGVRHYSDVMLSAENI